MAEEKRNLCAQIPISLHSRVRQEQEASGQTLSEYMTQLITNYFHMKEENQGNMNAETRTVAFQVPPELFEEFKAYLQRNHLRMLRQGLWPSRCRPSCSRSSRHISSAITSSRRSFSWPASRGPWQRRTRQTSRRPIRSRWRRPKPNNAKCKHRRDHPGGVCFSK